MVEHGQWHQKFIQPDMSKEILDHTEQGRTESATSLKVLVICGLILGWVNFAIDFLIDQDKRAGVFWDQLELGLLLLAAWIAINAGINTLNRLLPKAAVGWLIVTGIGIGILGLFVHTSFLWLIVRHVTKTAPDFSWIQYFKEQALPAISVSLVVTILTVITARVENKTMGLVLKLLLFALIGFMVYLFMK